MHRIHNPCCGADPGASAPARMAPEDLQQRARPRHAWLARPRTARMPPPPQVLRIASQLLDVLQYLGSLRPPVIHRVRSQGGARGAVM
jgi:hypothetical protein